MKYFAVTIKKGHNMAKKHYESRRRDEMKAAGMISEDHSEVANMPQSVKYTAWPKHSYGLDSNLDDTIAGIDRQINKDDSQGRKGMNPHKY